VLDGTSSVDPPEEEPEEEVLGLDLDFEPLKLVGLFPGCLFVTTDFSQLPVFPPTFFFNQSLPLLTTLSAT